MDIIKLPARTDSPVWPKRKNKISLDQIFFGLLYLLERSVVETRYIFSLFKFKTLGSIIATCLEGVLNNMIKGKVYKVTTGSCFWKHCWSPVSLQGHKMCLIQGPYSNTNTALFLSNVAIQQLPTDLQLHIMCTTNSHYTEVF